MTIKKQKGFTLIEVIVVLIIVGILAAIAIESIFNWFESSYSAEASPVEEIIANQIDACIATGQTPLNCITVTQAAGPMGSIAVCSVSCVSASVFSSAATPHFVYTYLAGNADGFTDPAYAILALRADPSGGFYNLVLKGGFFSSGPNICGTANVSNGSEQYIILCRDASGNHSMQGIGDYRNIF